MTDPSSGTPAFLPDAGWYPDATTPGLWRWWDGEEWTEHVHRPEGPEDEAVIAATQAATAAAVSEAAAAAAAQQPQVVAAASPSLQEYFAQHAAAGQSGVEPEVVPQPVVDAAATQPPFEGAAPQGAALQGAAVPPFAPQSVVDPGIAEPLVVDSVLAQPDVAEPVVATAVPSAQSEPPAAASMSAAPAAAPGLTLPDPALAEPSLHTGGFTPGAAAAPSLQAPQFIELPKLHPDLPAAYVPPVPAPFPPPAPDHATPRITAQSPQVASFRGRGSSLHAARAARTQTVEMQKPNPTAIVSLVFGIVAILAPVVIFALVSIFTGLFGLRRASESFPPVGRGAATAGIVLGIISLLLTAIASMIAMADPAIRAIVLDAI